MSTFTKKISTALTALVLGSALAMSGVASAPALAGGFHHHGGGWGHHGGGWGWGRGYGWGFRYIGYPGYYGGCYLKRYVDYDGEIIVRRVCY